MKSFKDLCKNPHVHCYFVKTVLSYKRQFSTGPGVQLITQDCVILNINKKSPIA